MWGETILEAITTNIDAKVSPLIEKVERIEKLDRVSQADLQNLDENLKAYLQAASCTGLKGFIDATGKKFRVTAKLIESTMNALEQTTRAKKCEDDVKGLALLKGEENPIGIGGGKA